MPYFWVMQIVHITYLVLSVIIGRSSHVCVRDRASKLYTGCYRPRRSTKLLIRRVDSALLTKHAHDAQRRKGSRRVGGLWQRCPEDWSRGMLLLSTRSGSPGCRSRLRSTFFPRDLIVRKSGD